MRSFRCPRCSELKEREDFYWGKAGKRSVTCKGCARAAWVEWCERNKPHRQAYQREYLKVYRRTHAEAISAYQRAWAQRNRERRNARARDTWDRRRPYQEAYRAKHRARRLAQKREWYQKHREQRRIQDKAKRSSPEYRAFMKRYLRRWLVANRDRHNALHRAREARKRGASTTEPVSRMAIYVRERGVCYLCSRQVSRRKFHLEHVEALVLGGAHTAANVRVAHPLCNLRKGRKRVAVQLSLAV